MNGPQSRVRDISRVPVRQSLPCPPLFVSEKVEALWKVTRVIRRIDLHRSRVMGIRMVGEGQYPQRMPPDASGIWHARETDPRSSCSPGVGADRLPKTYAAVPSLPGEFWGFVTRRTAADGDGVCAEGVSFHVPSGSILRRRLRIRTTRSVFSRGSAGIDAFAEQELQGDKAPRRRRLVLGCCPRFLMYRVGTR